MARFSRASSRVAAGSPEGLRVGDRLDQMAAVDQLRAGAEVVKAADEMMGTLIDVLV